MRSVLLLCLLAILGISRATWSAECTEVCEPVVYTGIASPNCTDAVCEIVCTECTAEEACDDIEETVKSCKVRCDTSACFNTTPPCETQCKRELDCESEKNCSMYCEEPVCNWILIPPPDAPEPECNITCEAVTCDSSMTTTPSSSSSRFSLF